MLEWIDKGLDNFGTTAKLVIYYRLETNHGLQKNDVPRRPEIFLTVLKEMFGAGSAVIEDRIVSSIIEGLRPRGVSRSDGAVHVISEARRELFEKRLQ